MKRGGGGYREDKVSTDVDDLHQALWLIGRHIEGF